MVGAAAFSSEVEGIREALSEVLGADGTALADPTTAVTAEQFPWSLYPEIRLDRVRLTLYQQRWHRMPAPLILQQDEAGITIAPDSSEPRKVPWHYLTRARVEGMTLHLGPVQLSCTEHPPEHLAWLASHLQARSKRLAATLDERRSFSRNASHIDRMQRSNMSTPSADR